MFGHHDDKKDDQKDTEAVAPDNGQAAVDDTFVPESPVEPPLSQASWQHPGTPMGDQPASSSFDQPSPVVDTDEAPADHVAEPEPIADVISPAGGFPRSTDTQASSHFPTPSLHDNGSDDQSDIVDTSSSSHELIDIKQRALGELSPLLDQLDQAPEEKFRTLMMMIQASDDQKLVKAAYEAAHSIDDEKARAQALLDIVNEINYFTSSHQEV